MSDAAMLALRGVSVCFGERAVLDDVTAIVERGRRLALIGPSGAGKSTALRLLVGLVRPTRGRVEVGGAALTPATVAAARRRLGYVIQDGGLFPHLSARDNAALAAVHAGWERSRIAARIAELAALVRLPEALLGRYPAQLSGGQRQRVALMRGLFLDPEVLLLDEPLAALDPMVRAELQDDLRALFADTSVSGGRTVLLVTHDLAEAALLADDLALMRDGRIVQRGPIAALAQAPVDDFVRRFVRAQRGLALGGHGADGA